MPFFALFPYAVRFYVGPTTWSNGPRVIKMDILSKLEKQNLDEIQIEPELKSICGRYYLADAINPAPTCKCGHFTQWVDKEGVRHCTRCERPSSMVFVCSILGGAWMEGEEDGDPAVLAEFDVTNSCLAEWREAHQEVQRAVWAACEATEAKRLGKSASTPEGEF